MLTCHLLGGCTVDTILTILHCIFSFLLFKLSLRIVKFSFTNFFQSDQNWKYGY